MNASEHQKIFEMHLLKFMKLRMESANVVRELRVRARNILKNYVAKVSTQICMIMNNINIQE